MAYACRAASALLIAAGLASAAATAAHAASPGGSSAPASNASGGKPAKTSSPRLSGGSAYGVPGTPPAVGRPTVGLLNVPASAPPGRPPRVTLRIDEPGAALVQVRVTVTDLSTRSPVIVVALGWVHTGRALTVRWPRGATLSPGSYHVSLIAQDSHASTLLRRAHSSGVATLVVSAPPPQPRSSPPQGGAATTPAGVPTPAQLAAAGAVFPVAGAHDFGGPDNRFGAPRRGYTHQGQDVLTAEGTPIVAPLNGAVLTVGYQASGAGYYAAEHAGTGLDFFFAHCMPGSLAVATGESLSAGQLLCRAGQTGYATAPHLHFEIWVGAWRGTGAYPIDPLPYLVAWDHTAAGG